MNIEEREKYLKKKQTVLLEGIAPQEMELIRHMLQNDYDPARDVLPTVFDFYTKTDGGEELLCSYVMIETKTRKIIKPVKGKARLKYLKNEKEKDTNKKEPVRKSVSK